MAEDPLFDPWSTAEPEESASTRAEEPSPRRWSSTATTTGDVPKARPVPRGRSRSTPSSGRPTPSPPPVTTRPTALAERLRSVVVPWLEALSARLEIARHHTLLDDRLDGGAPTLRFRLAPRQGPFDEPRPVAGSVLEILVDGREVVVRLWLDPLAEEATEEHRIDAHRLSEGWIEDVGMDFVARTLRGA